MTNQLAPSAHQPPIAPIERELEEYSPNFAAVLPPNIPVDHFKRMVMTAVSINPDLVNADRRTLFNSCVKCASDGLLPDGREAALVIYRTKVKDAHGREHWIDAIQYMPMIAGVRKRLRNSGEVDSAIAEVVYRRDRFKYRLGDGAFIEHEPPPLDEDRGEAVGAYAIIRLSSGEVIREVMSLKEIERIRSVSKAATQPSGPWVKWWSEMARKSVLRRAAKAAPQASTLEKLLMRDEETDHLPGPEALPAIPARPRREDFVVVPGDGGASVAYDHQTGEVIDDLSAEDIIAAGDNAADGGTENFTQWWNSPDVKPHRNDIRHRLEGWRVIATAADQRGGPAPEESADEDPFGLAPAAGNAEPDTGEVKGGGHHTGASSSADNTQPPSLGGGNSAQSDLALGGEVDEARLDSFRDLLAGDPPDWKRYADRFVWLCENTNAATRAAVQIRKLPRAMKCRTESGDNYRRMQLALAGR